jgi:hypothetical protein
MILIYIDGAFLLQYDYSVAFVVSFILAAIIELLSILGSIVG